MEEEVREGGGSKKRKKKFGKEEEVRCRKCENSGKFLKNQGTLFNTLKAPKKIWGLTGPLKGQNTVFA